MVFYLLVLAQRRNQMMHYTRECSPDVHTARSSPHWVSSRYFPMVPLWAHERTGHQYAISITNIQPPAGDGPHLDGSAVVSLEVTPSSHATRSRLLALPGSGLVLYGHVYTPPPLASAPLT